MVVACPADDFSQTLTTRETLRQQERDQRLQPRTLDGNLAYRRGTGAYGSLRAPEENFGEGTARPA